MTQAMRHGTRHLAFGSSGGYGTKFLTLTLPQQVYLYILASPMENQWGHPFPSLALVTLFSAGIIMRVPSAGLALIVCQLSQALPSSDNTDQNRIISGKLLKYCLLKPLATLMMMLTTICRSYSGHAASMSQRRHELCRRYHVR